MIRTKEGLSTRNLSFSIEPATSTQIQNIKQIKSCRGRASSAFRFRLPWLAQNPLRFDLFYILYLGE